jgi:hypothetical protein
MLVDIGCIHIAQSVNQHYSIEPPDSDWLTHATSSLGIDIVNPVELDEARARLSNPKTIEEFFSKCSAYFDRDPRLIINVDETQISSHRKFKVLQIPGQAPIRHKREELPHFTAMCAIIGNGMKLPPTIILPGNKTFPEDLLPYKDKANFLSSSSEWMTKRAFLIWCFFLIYELSVYRVQLPPELQTQRFVVLIDGHSSRSCWEAMKLLSENLIDVVCLPSHTTQILQPFDMTVGSALKNEFEKLMLLALDSQGIELCSSPPADEENTLGKIRSSAIGCFLEAWFFVANERNINI